VKVLSNSIFQNVQKGILKAPRYFWCALTATATCR